MKPLPRFFIAAMMVLGVVTIAKIWVSKKHTSAPTMASIDSPIKVHSVKASCRPVLGERTAFQISSQVSTQGQSDHFKAVMSWEVVASNAGNSRIRAAFSHVDFTQDLTLPKERAASPEGTSFFLEIDSNCAVITKAFPSEWDAKTRTLVSTQIDNYAFVLPKTQNMTWKTKASDGMGVYTASFTLEEQKPLLIRRQKSDHLSHESAKSFGIDISLDEANALASFDDTNPIWWQSVTGQEEITVRTPGQPAVTMVQTYHLERDHTQFVNVPKGQWRDADIDTSTNDEPQQITLINTHKSYTQARTSFANAITETPPRYFDAALELAAWLQENPKDVDLVVAELLGDLDDELRASTFHALELSGTHEARTALSLLINDYALSDVDQARAVSALADLGEPTLDVANLLLTRADEDDTAGKLSILALGSMMTQTDNVALKNHVLSALHDRHADASDDASLLLLLDSMGNSEDPYFLEVLSDELNSNSNDVRRHAAAALSKLPAEQSVPVLISRLNDEYDSRVSITLIKALKDTQVNDPELTTSLDQRLAYVSKNQRVAIVDLLGTQDTDDARLLLAKQFKREDDIRIKQLIGRYLPAEALR